MKVLDVFPRKTAYMQNSTHKFQSFIDPGIRTPHWVFSTYSFCFFALSESCYFLAVNPLPRRYTFFTFRVLFERSVLTTEELLPNHGFSSYHIVALQLKATLFTLYSLYYLLTFGTYFCLPH